MRVGPAGMVIVPHAHVCPPFDGHKEVRTIASERSVLRRPRKRYGTWPRRTASTSGAGRARHSACSDPVARAGAARWGSSGAAAAGTPGEVSVLVGRPEAGDVRLALGRRNPPAGRIRARGVDGPRDRREFRPLLPQAAGPGRRGAAAAVGAGDDGAGGPVAMGCTNAEIRRQPFIGKPTVKTPLLRSFGQVANDEGPRRRWHLGPVKPVVSRVVPRARPRSRSPRPPSARRTPCP